MQEQQNHPLWIRNRDFIHLFSISYPSFQIISDLSSFCDFELNNNYWLIFLNLGQLLDNESVAMMAVAVMQWKRQHVHNAAIQGFKVPQVHLQNKTHPFKWLFVGQWKGEWEGELLKLNSYHGFQGVLNEMKIGKSCFESCCLRGSPFDKTCACVLSLWF